MALDGKDGQLSTLPAGGVLRCLYNLLAGAELETVLRCGEETEILLYPWGPCCWRVWSGTPVVPALRKTVQPKAPVSAPAHRTAHHAVLPWAGHRPSVGQSGQERGCEAHRLPEDLARQLGVSRAALFRELAALQSMGVLRSEGISSPCWIRPRWKNCSTTPPAPNDQERKYRTNEKLLSLFCALSLSAALLAGCSGGNGNTNATADGAESTSPTLTEPETTSLKHPLQWM